MTKFCSWLSARTVVLVYHSFGIFMATHVMGMVFEGGLPLVRYGVIFSALLIVLCYWGLCMRSSN